MGLGFFRKFHELIEEIRGNNPLDQTARAMYMLRLGPLGEMKQAEKEYELGKKIFGDPWLPGDRFIFILPVGSKDVLSMLDIPEGLRLDPKVSILIEHLDSPEEGLEELLRIYSCDNNLSSSDLFSLAISAAYFSDPDLALNAMARSV